MNLRSHVLGASSGLLRIISQGKMVLKRPLNVKNNLYGSPQYFQERGPSQGNIGKTNQNKVVTVCELPKNGGPCIGWEMGPYLLVKIPKQPPPFSLTHTAWLLSRPLVILLARDCLLPHQLKGRLALKCQCVPMMKPGAFPPAVGRDSRITAAALLNL